MKSHGRHTLRRRPAQQRAAREMRAYRRRLRATTAWLQASQQARFQAARRAHPFDVWEGQ